MLIMQFQDQLSENSQQQIYLILHYQQSELLSQHFEFHLLSNDSVKSSIAGSEKKNTMILGIYTPDCISRPVPTRSNAKRDERNPACGCVPVKYQHAQHCSSRSKTFSKQMYTEKQDFLMSYQYFTIACKSPFGHYEILSQAWPNYGLSVMYDLKGFPC